MEGAVDLTYQDSSLRGTVADEPVLLTMGRGGRRSRCSGTFQGRDVHVEWNIDSNHKSLDPVSLLHGTADGAPVDLTAQVHLTSYHSLRHVDIVGTFGDQKIQAHIAAVEAPAAGPTVVVIDGTLDGAAITLYAGIESNRGGGRIEGLVAGKQIRLAAVRTLEAGIQVTGAYSGPPELLNLLVGTLLYFS